MQLPAPLFQGTLLKRYKRFLADVELETGEMVTAHCANPGAMLGLDMPGLPVWLSHSADPKRKLPYSLQLVDVEGALVGINTSLPNKLAEEAIPAGVIPELDGYGSLRREVKYGQNSRIDLLLEDGPDARPAYVEIKNVHLCRKPGLAEFPDCVTARGAKHLGELAEMTRQGARSVMLYVIQRGDCEAFTFARDLDPGYFKAFLQARSEGVEALCYACDVTVEGIRITRPIPLILE